MSRAEFRVCFLPFRFSFFLGGFYHVSREFAEVGFPFLAVAAVSLVVAWLGGTAQAVTVDPIVTNGSSSMIENLDANRGATQPETALIHSLGKPVAQWR